MSESEDTNVPHYSAIADDSDSKKRGSRRYVGTKNNYTEQDIVSLVNFFHNPNCVYLVYGEEVAPTTGTPHLQIYIELKNCMTMTALNKKIFNSWWGVCKGSPEDASGYCKKGECGDHIHDPYSDRCELCQGYKDSWSYFDYRTSSIKENWIGDEFGRNERSKGQGKRTDVDAPVEAIMGGASLRDIAREFPHEHVKYHRGFRDLVAMVREPRYLSKMPEVHVLWGPTETGKSWRSIHEYWPDIPHYMWSPLQGKWFDRYDGEKKLILDEFRGEDSLPFHQLLSMFDWKACQIEYKGGFTELLADKFIITSPTHPSTWYPHCSDADNANQLYRRLTSVVHCAKKFVPPGHEPNHAASVCSVLSCPNNHDIRDYMTSQEDDPMSDSRSE